MAAPPSVHGASMDERIRALDWSSTPLGPPAQWPASLKTAVRIMLTSRFAMWMAWGEELIFFCNDAYLPTTGLKSNWVLGTRSDLVWAEIWPDIGPRIRHVLQTGEATWDEALLLYLERRGFTEESYHTFSYSPLEDDAGSNVGMLCVVAEVTERIINERQLATLRDLGARLAGAPTTAQVMRTLESCLAEWPRDLPFAIAYLFDAAMGHAELAAIHGLEPFNPLALQTVGRHEQDAVWPIGRVLEHGEQLVAVSESLLGEVFSAHGNGVPRQALVTPIGGAEGGAPLGFLVAGLNPNRALDAGYRGFIGLFAGQLAAAISRAEEYERERARAEALAEIDRAKTAFFSNVSHEFRTPLTLLLGPLEDALAEGAQLPPLQAERLDMAHRNGLRLLRLVNGLLDFARMEAGRNDANYVSTDLAAYTSELASTFRSAFERASLAFDIDCPPLAAPVLVDRDMWEKIVLNLLSNALKFTFDGCVTVKLAQSDGQALLTVSDTGTGIPAAELPRLFERFHRVQGARGRSFEGSGIGLALVHDLARLQGGEVSVTSVPGQGSVFRVAMPMGAHLPQDRIAERTGLPTTATRAHAFVDEALRWLPGVPNGLGHDMIADVQREARPAAGAAPAAGRVLLADDNADLRDYLSRLLQGRGYEVQAVRDGEEALQAARLDRPDLVLTDVMMPVLDGFGLLAAIRGDETLADLPVIVLSARAGEEAQIEGLQSGADDYLAKPFSARELLARVAANLAMARMRRQMNDTIRRSEARLRGVLDGMGEGFVLLDADYRILEMNPAGLRQEPRPREMLQGRTLWDAYPQTHDAEAGRLYRQAMAERMPVSLEHCYTWQDGRQAWLDMRTYPTDDGGIAIFFRDITERRQAEEALQEANRTLERRVAETVSERELVLAQLHEAQKLETLGQLTGGVAHDFNNLLTPVMSGMELLRRWHTDDRSQRIVGGAMQSAERAKTLVQRLLAFARRQTLAPQAVDPATLIHGLRDLIGHSVGATIRIDLDIAPDLPAALVDPNQLEMAILNLAVNARDAMQNGGTLRIVARAEDVQTGSGPAIKPGRYVRLAVGDTGIGMNEATRQRAIEPFFSTKGVGQGTGLGLSMVHGLAIQSGGGFHLASEMGVGTIVTLWLPVAANLAVELGKPHFEPPAAPRSANLLLVDDEALVRASTAALLRELGYEVTEAVSAGEALEIVRRGNIPDLVITDHLMPGMTGAELARELRARVAVIPTLIITGYAHLPAGEIRDFELLAKPFTFAELASRVARLVCPEQDNVVAYARRQQ